MLINLHLRHVTYVFECDDVSTKTLLALSRHCIGKDISVQSTRWTTKKRKGRTQLHKIKCRRQEIENLMRLWI